MLDVDDIKNIKGQLYRVKGNEPVLLDDPRLFGRSNLVLWRCLLLR